MSQDKTGEAVVEMRYWMNFVEEFKKEKKMLMAGKIEKHFVTFYSPGTFVAEETTKPIAKWDVEKAKSMAETISERYGATPYGFRFTTRSRDWDDFEPKETAQSNMYYINCRVLTVEDLEKENRDDNRILIRNMKSHDWSKVVQTTKGWRWSAPLNEEDVVLS